jgi:hypothetical protein
MLLNHEPGSTVEIRDVLRTAPPAWLVILNVETITRTGMLQSQVALHETVLIAATDIQSSQAVTVSTLPSILRNMGVASSTSRPFRRFRNPVSSSASAHVVSVEEDEDGGQLPELEDPDTLTGATSLDIDTISAIDPIVAEAYNSSAKCQRPPPKGGYKFPKADHVVSRIGPPPSPCKMCGSSKHWDKECPHKAQWDAMGTANIIQVDRSIDDDRVYSKAFEAPHPIYFFSVCRARTFSKLPLSDVSNGDSLPLALTSLHRRNLR